MEKETYYEVEIIGLSNSITYIKENEKGCIACINAILNKGWGLEFEPYLIKVNKCQTIVKLDNI